MWRQPRKVRIWLVWFCPANERQVALRTYKPVQHLGNNATSTAKTENMPIKRLSAFPSVLPLDHRCQMRLKCGKTVIGKADIANLYSLLSQKGS